MTVYGYRQFVHSGGGFRRHGAGRGHQRRFLSIFVGSLSQEDASIQEPFPMVRHMS